MADRSGLRRSVGWWTRYWLPVIAYVAGILTLSAQPHLRAPIAFRNSDKIYHAAEYFVLGILLSRAVWTTLRAPRVPVAAGLAVALGIGVAAGDEYLQSFVPGRQSSVFDAVADTLGVVIAQLVYLRVRDRRVESA